MSSPRRLERNLPGGRRKTSRNHCFRKEDVTYRVHSYFRAKEDEDGQEPPWTALRQPSRGQPRGEGKQLPYWARRTQGQRARTWLFMGFTLAGGARSETRRREGGGVKG